MPESDVSNDPTPPKNEESTLLEELLAGVTGAIVTICCALPPLVHLVTGPLGPFIGGFVAGNKVSAGVRGRVIIAVSIGTGLAGILGIAAGVLLSFAQRSELPSWFPSSQTLGAILAGVWVYAAVLATAGAAVSASLKTRRQKSV
jgi:hypothetical protein